jgi:hypothetical protein
VVPNLQKFPNFSLAQIQIWGVRLAGFANRGAKNHKTPTYESAALPTELRRPEYWKGSPILKRAGTVEQSRCHNAPLAFLNKLLTP